ncbi:MAG: hypothetical protein AB1630_07440 [bacterium]
MNRILILFLILSTSIFSQEMITIPKKDLDDMLKHLNNLKKLENATPTFELKNYTIIIDNKGRIYTEDKLYGTMTLGYKMYGLVIEMPAIVNRKDPSLGFKFKIKEVNVLSIGKKKDDLEITPAIGFLLQFYRTKRIILSVVGATDVFGTGLSIDFNKKTDLLLGVGINYKGNFSGFIGTSFEVF